LIEQGFPKAKKGASVSVRNLAEAPFFIGSDGR